MRLCLASKDYIRSQIMSKKLSIRFFENTDNQELKLKFYRYMIEMDEHERNYLNICRHYRAVYDTPSIQEDALQKLQTLKNPETIKKSALIEKSASRKTGIR